VADPEEDAVEVHLNKGFVGDDGVEGPRAEEEKLEYNAASPDEKALVEACGQAGVRFLGEEEDGEVRCRLRDSRTGPAQEQVAGGER
jgi:hypothetical protein